MNGPDTRPTTGQQAPPKTPDPDTGGMRDDVEVGADHDHSDDGTLDEGTNPQYADTDLTRKSEDK
ncbi:MAG: hypothetical protein ACRD3Q_04315 [Terriglobales bacterium]